MLSKVISGGQTGVDTAGLGAAYAAGLATGGTMAHGFMQSIGRGQDAANRSLAEKYGLVEGRMRVVGEGRWDRYYLRTIANAQAADGTVWFGRTDSPGALLTLGRVAQKGKVPALVNPETAEQVRAWVLYHGIRVLNVAGNREWTNPGIYKKAYDLLLETFLIM